MFPKPKSLWMPPLQLEACRKDQSLPCSCKNDSLCGTRVPGQGGGQINTTEVPTYMEVSKKDRLTTTKRHNPSSKNPKPSLEVSYFPSPRSVNSTWLQLSNSPKETLSCELYVMHITCHKQKDPNIEPTTRILIVGALKKVSQLLGNPKS